MTKCGVIDVGSNSVRMGIFEKQNSGVVQTERFRKQVRISEGITKDNLLKEEPVKRTLEAIQEFKDILDKKGIADVKMVATEALRRAKNSATFTDEVKRVFDIDVEIIDGLKEAHYDVFAAQMTANYNDFYMIDTGGGSVEIALVSGGKIEKAVCLPLGSVVMTESFRPDENGTQELESFIKSELEKADIIKNNKFPIVALGGSNKELAKIDMKICSDNIDGHKMSAKSVFAVYNNLKTMTCDERKKVEGFDEKRADTIVSGLCPIMTLCTLSGSKEICFCTGSVSEGVAAELLL